MLPTIVGAVVFVVVFGIVWRLGPRKTHRLMNRTNGREIFQRRREWLEAKFLTLASQSGLPRGLTWTDCDFEDGVAFARERRTGELKAFVGVTISFEATKRKRKIRKIKKNKNIKKCK